MKKLCDFCAFDRQCQATNKEDKACVMFSGKRRYHVKETYTKGEYFPPPKWKETKESLPKIIEKIVNDDHKVRSIHIEISVAVDEAPTVKYEIERYGWE